MARIRAAERLLIGARARTTKSIQWTSKKWGHGSIPVGTTGKIKRVLFGNELIIDFGPRYGQIGVFVSEVKLA